MSEYIYCTYFISTSERCVENRIFHSVRALLEEKVNTIYSGLLPLYNQQNIIVFYKKRAPVRSRVKECHKIALVRRGHSETVRDHTEAGKAPNGDVSQRP